MWTSLDHVLVAVHDLPAATRILATLLGRSPSWQGEHPGAGTGNVLFRLANTYLELLAPVGDGPAGQALARHLEQSGEGPFGLAFGTPDAAAAGRALADRGLATRPAELGEGRDAASGAVRRWRTVWLAPERSRGVALFGIEHLDPPELLPPAPPLAPEPACVAALDHVVVAAGDLEATRALYGDGLGLRLALDRRFEARGLRILFFRVGGVTVEAVGALADASQEGGKPPPTAGRDRLAGLAFRVPDAAAARERVAAAGFDVSPVRDGFKPGTRVCSVRGRPLGIDTLLLEPAPREG